MSLSVLVISCSILIVLLFCLGMSNVKLLLLYCYFHLFSFVNFSSLSLILLTQFSFFCMLHCFFQHPSLVLECSSSLNRWKLWMKTFLGCSNPLKLEYLHTLKDTAIFFFFVQNLSIFVFSLFQSLYFCFFLFFFLRMLLPHIFFYINLLFSAHASSSCIMCHEQLRDFHFVFLFLF